MATGLVVRNGANSEIAKTERAKAAQRIKTRRDRAMAANAKIDRVALFDGSGSMCAEDALDVRMVKTTRWLALCSAWDQLAPLGKDRLGAYVFSDHAVPVKGAASGTAVALPFSGGGTSMMEALTAARYHGCAGLHVLLVSDGCPTDGTSEQVIAAALAIGAPVDTVYVGPMDSHAEGLMRSIASATGGTFVNMAHGFDASKLLSVARSWLLLK